MLRFTYFCLLVLLGQVLTEKISYKNYKVYKITPKNEEALKTLQNFETNISGHLQYHFWKGPTKVGHEASLMVAPDLKENLESMLHSLDVDIELAVDDVEELIKGENTLRTGSANPVNWQSYNTLDEINAWLEGLADEFPKHVTILKPGKTHQGRDIVGLKLDLTPSIPNKKAVFMESNIHAREWISSATTTWILNQFLRNNTDERIKNVAGKYTWYFFPVMNPDGFVYTHTTDRFWRKTRTRNSVLCYGADPNRNWGFKWMEGGSSSNRCSDLYAGPHAWSEPCVTVMRDFISSIGSNILAYFDFHSYSQYFLLPYGHTKEKLDNYEEMMAIGTKAISNLKKVHGTEYIIGNIAETIYVATGSSMDWVKDKFKTPIAACYELRDTGTNGFILPADQIIPTAEETLESILTIFEEWEKLHPSS